MNFIDLWGLDVTDTQAKALAKAIAGWSPLTHNQQVKFTPGNKGGVNKGGGSTETKVNKSDDSPETTGDQQDADPDDVTPEKVDPKKNETGYSSKYRRRILNAPEGTKAHGIIFKEYKDRLIARGYENPRTNLGMKFDPSDPKCYSRCRPDFRADKNNEKYIWEVKQEGIDARKAATNSLEKYQYIAEKAGDSSLIPGENLGNAKLSYDDRTHLRVYQPEPGIILYEAWEIYEEPEPLAERRKSPERGYNWIESLMLAGAAVGQAFQAAPKGATGMAGGPVYIGSGGGGIPNYLCLDTPWK